MDKTSCYVQNVFRYVENVFHYVQNAFSYVENVFHHVQNLIRPVHIYSFVLSLNKLLCIGETGGV